MNDERVKRHVLTKEMEDQLKEVDDLIRKSMKKDMPESPGARDSSPKKNFIMRNKRSIA